ncbi:hypothetical protein GJAV_G00129010 [Gymnothorax javanicus]|nr:hypothetical protein GJAV_G00129010 [Gymnothorax javanicus]
MADSRYQVPPEEYRCPLCMDVLRDPVSIPCGDTYCLECIKIYWDQADHVGVYSCPQCRATFTPRPVLKRNVPNVAQNFHQLSELASFSFLQRDSQCDFCIGRKSKAVKSCLTCLAYYYEERAEKQKVLVETQAEVLHIIQDRTKELQELRHNVDVLKSCSRRAMSDCNKIFAEMTGVVERWHSEINSLIEANEKAAMSQAESYVERLELEIVELQRRDLELRHILETEDNIHFLQNFPTLCVPPEPMVPKVLINPEFSFGEITKTVSNMKEHLEDICKKDQSKICKTISDTPVYQLLPRNGGVHLKAPSGTELQDPETRAEFLKYACPLTLDPNTAYRELVLSDGYRKVTRKKAAMFYPDHTERFDSFSQVLCREPLSEFRYYWEVQWSGEFSVGVAYKSISRKGKNSSCLLGYNNKSWSLLCSDTGYSAWHNKTDKDLPSTLQASKIGVYLDYVRGLLAFYDVSNSMRLIHRFQARFTEPLFAGFGVGSSVSICHLNEGQSLE